SSPPSSPGPVSCGADSPTTRFGVACASHPRVRYPAKAPPPMIVAAAATLIALRRVVVGGASLLRSASSSGSTIGAAHSRRDRPCATRATLPTTSASFAPGGPCSQEDTSGYHAPTEPQPHHHGRDRDPHTCLPRFRVHRGDGDVCVRREVTMHGRSTDGFVHRRVEAQLRGVLAQAVSPLRQGRSGTDDHEAVGPLAGDVGQGGGVV